MVHRVDLSRRPYFPDGLRPDEIGLVALGGEIEVDIVVEAYRKGIFPWTGEHPIPWFSPDPRLILAPQQLRVNRSLRKAARRFEVRFDHDFVNVMLACASIPRPEQDGTWITPNMIETYTELHRRGIAHSVEIYRDASLVGGLYGLCFGDAFFGESMFSLESNASKVALMSLCERLVERDYHFVDCQQVTEHMLRLGAVPVTRSHYLRLLEEALASESEHRSWSER